MTTRTRNGQSLLEFALILPLLLMLVFGIIESSVAMYDKAVITNASREGARVGIVKQDRSTQALVDSIKAQIKQTARDYCSTHLITFGNPIGALNIPDPVFDDPSSFGSNLTVTVQYSYGFLFLPRFATGVVGPWVLKATTVMKIE